VAVGIVQYDGRAHRREIIEGHCIERFGIHRALAPSQIYTKASRLVAFSLKKPSYHQFFGSDILLAT